MITDALDMGALDQGPTQAIEVVAMMRAGVDLLMCMPDPDLQERVRSAVERGYARDLIPDHVFANSRRRIDRIRAGLSRSKPDPGFVGREGELATELAKKSVTVVRNDDGLLPIRLDPVARILSLEPVPTRVTPADTSDLYPPGLATALRARHTQVTEIVYPHRPGSADISGILAESAKHHLVVVGTVNAGPEQSALVNGLLQIGTPLVTVALRAPYDLASYPGSVTHLSTYSGLEPSLRAMVGLLFDGGGAGKLPVAIPSLHPHGHGMNGMTALTGGEVLTANGLVETDLTAGSDGLAFGVVEGAATLDVTGMTVVPGLIDIQVNGAFGHDFTDDPESIWEVGARLPETGVTSFLPTIVTSPYEVAEHMIEVLRAGPPPGYLGADVLGLHIEGPWISPDWNGAHDPSLLLPPDPGRAASWADSGVVRMVTIAPELEGAAEAASVLARAGVVVSAGHTGADYETASSALIGDWGSVTHLFNQMAPFQHREPGMVGAALQSMRPCGLIADGIHSHPAVVRLAWRVLGPERLILVTDAMAAMGLGPGTYLLGGQTTTVDENGPRTAEGRLAGSVLTMLDAVANLSEWAEIPFAEAVPCATSTPAALLGLEDRGRIETRLRADVTVLDQTQRVFLTLVDGQIAYRREAG